MHSRFLKVIAARAHRRRFGNQWRKAQQAAINAERPGLSDRRRRYWENQAAEKMHRCLRVPIPRSRHMRGVAVKLLVRRVRAAAKGPEAYSACKALEIQECYSPGAKTLTYPAP